MLQGIILSLLDLDSAQVVDSMVVCSFNQLVVKFVLFSFAFSQIEQSLGKGYADLFVKRIFHLLVVELRFEQKEALIGVGLGEINRRIEVVGLKFGR